VTLHRGRDRADLLRLWLKEARGYRLLETLNGRGARMFQAPVVLPYDGEVPPMRCSSPGTGSYHKDTIFRFTPDGGLRHVDFVRAPDPYPGLGSGEGLWKGERNVFTDDRMTFDLSAHHRGSVRPRPSRAARWPSGTIASQHRTKCCY